MNFVALSRSDTGGSVGFGHVLKGLAVLFTFCSALGDAALYFWTLEKLRNEAYLSCCHKPRRECQGIVSERVLVPGE